jgi:hypothetical protein
MRACMRACVHACAYAYAYLHMHAPACALCERTNGKARRLARAIRFPAPSSGVTLVGRVRAVAAGGWVGGMGCGRGVRYDTILKKASFLDSFCFLRLTDDLLQASAPH